MGSTSFCDKCKIKEFEDHPCGDEVRGIGTIEGDTGYRNGKYSAEICSHCAMLLQLWLEKKPTKKEIEELRAERQRRHENEPTNYD